VTRLAHQPLGLDSAPAENQKPAAEPRYSASRSLSNDADDAGDSDDQDNRHENDETFALNLIGQPLAAAQTLHQPEAARQHPKDVGEGFE
jgi:hypothetical protein